MITGNDPQQENFIVAGIDLFKGSIFSREGATYSISILSREKTLYEAQDVSLPRILRILHEYKPRYIVVDNIYELAPDKRTFNKILSLLPESTEIILATYDPVKGFRDLREIAQEYGIYESRKKPDSLSSARILARLGLLGVGYKIRVWEERVKIIVSRNRSSRAGGSSEDRYKRASRAYVYRIARKIRDALERNGISYELLIKRSSGGIDRAIFIVEGSRERLKGVVKPMKGRYVRVVIRPLIRSVVNLPREVESKTMPVIVGIDPGINYGIAVMGLDGEIYTTGTIQGGDLGSILGIIQKYGVPLVVATDKKPVPESVKKIASLYGAKIYEPDHIPSDAEKEDLIKDIGYKVSTVHERDALYSALSFYRKMLPKFTQVESIVNKLSLDVDTYRIRSDLIRGLDLATIIENIFAEILSEDNVKKDLFIIKDFIKEYVASENRLRRLEEEYHRLLSENNYLRNKISDLERNLKTTFEELDSLKRDFKYEVYRDRELNVMVERLRTCQGSIKELETRIKDLEAMLNNYKKILTDLIDNRYTPIKKISEKNLRQGADLSKYSLSIRRDLNLVLLSEGASKELINLLLTRSSKNKLILVTLGKCFFNCLGDELNHVCCISIPERGIETIDLGEYILIRSEDLDKIYMEYKEMSSSLPKRIIYSVEELMKLIDEYRSSRKSQ